MMPWRKTMTVAAVAAFTLICLSAWTQGRAGQDGTQQNEGQKRMQQLRNQAHGIIRDVSIIGVLQLVATHLFTGLITA